MSLLGKITKYDEFLASRDLRIGRAKGAQPQAVQRFLAAREII